MQRQKRFQQEREFAQVNLPQVSIVVPVYNEESNLPELIQRTGKVCETLGVPYEMILVDDGSSDASMQMILDAAEKSAGKIVGVILSANFGQHAAVTAGLEVSRGKYVITMDADLQNPPEEIPRVLAKLQEGYDVVGTIRENRHDTFFRRYASKLVNRMTRSLGKGKNMTDYGCMLRGYGRSVVNAILQCREHGKFIPLLAMSFARRVTEIPVSHAGRTGGKSKYNCWKLIALQYDLLTGVSVLPLRFLTFVGFFIALFGILFGIVVFILSQIDKSWGAEGTFALFAIVIVLIGGQFAGMGLMGEYIGKIHMNARGRPQYFIEKIAGRPETDSSKQ